MPAVPYLKASVVHSADDGTVTLFLLNRSLDQELSVSVNASGFDRLAPSVATTLHNDDLEAANTRDSRPVAPTPLDAVEVSRGRGASHTTRRLVERRPADRRLNRMPADAAACARAAAIRAAG